MADLVPTSYARFEFSRAESGLIVLPAAYPAGGLVIDLRERFVSIDAFWIQLEAVAGVFNAVERTVFVNSPVPGKVTVRLYRLSDLKLAMQELTTQNIGGTTMRYTAFGDAAA